MGLGIFIVSVITVSIISLCFFKKRFWENRYLVLFISAGVALIATLTTNYVTRGGLNRTVETIWAKPIQVMSLDSTLVDSSVYTVNNELGFSAHFNTGDTTKTSKYSCHLFYYGDGGLRIGYAIGDDFKSKELDLVYIARSENDTTAYFTKKRIRYVDRNSKWVADFSLPYIKTIKCFYLPPTEYAMIPDSLIREIPF